MAEPFIKLYRKMLDWEWYDDVNTFKLFMHCLLRAEWQAGSWHGIHYEAGQFITSLPNLAKETNLSIQQVRTALKHLKSTGELTDNQQGAARIITVVKWGEYQGANRVSNRELTGNQQGANRELTPCKEYKEIKKSKEIKNRYGAYQNVKLTDQEHEKLIKDFGEIKTIAAIRFLDEYIEEKDYKSKNHNLAIRRWVIDAISKDREPSNTQSLAEKWGVTL